MPNSFYFQRNTNYFKTAFLCCYSISFKQYNTNSKKCAAHMRINPHRDTFFNLINFKTASKTQKSKTASSPKQNITKIPKDKTQNPKRTTKTAPNTKQTRLPPFTKNQTTAQLKKANQTRKPLRSKKAAFTKSLRNASN